jgi:prepilin-type N-terminal cleavage/methylation domain-containing protein/prepilin-type processing-associated H-X9-DG protein
MWNRGTRQMQRSGWGERGFSVIELLVVVAIIGLLIGLTLPAVQAARERGRRMHCSNNLKQIGLGVLGYHGAHGCFPPGNLTLAEGLCTLDDSSFGYPSQSGTNWLICILPFMEQQSLYETYDFNQFNEAPANRGLRESRVATYVCPADVTAEELLIPAAGPGGAFALKLPYMPGSYRAVTGRSDGVGFIDSGSFISYPREWRGAMHTVGIRGLETESLRHCGDGASHTLLAGESTTRTSLGWRTFWANSYAHYTLGAITPQRRVLWGDYDRCMTEGGRGASAPCKRGWGSFHPSGLNFVFVDGSVRFVQESIDMEILASLATIDGGEAATLAD